MALKWSDNSLSAYVRFGSNDVRPDRQRGRADGKRGFPETQAESFSAYEHQLLAQGNAALAQFAKSRNDQIDRLENQLTQLEHERDEGFRAARARLQGEMDAELDNTKKTYGPDSSRMATPREGLFEERKLVERLELELRRPLRVHFVRIYPVVLGALALVEVPINRLAFEFFFAESPLLSLAIAAGMGAALMIIAHFVGLLARRIPSHEALGVVLSVIAMVLLLAMALSAMYVVAVVRQHFVDFLEQEQSFDLGSLLEAGEIGDIATTLANVSLGAAGYTLLSFNLIVFAIGLLFAFFRHDPHPDYERAVFAKQRYQRQLDNAHREFEARSSAIDRKFQSRLSFLNQRISQIETQIAAVEAEIAAVRESGPEALSLVTNVIHQRVLAYQAGNEEKRTTAAPAYFGQSTSAWVAEGIKLP